MGKSAAHRWKAMKKLNGWKRIGIVASIVWIVGAGLYTQTLLQNEDMRINEEGDEVCENAALHDNKASREAAVRYADHGFAMKSSSDAVNAAIQAEEDRMINAADEVYRNDIKACDAQMTARQNADAPLDHKVAMLVGLVPVPVAWGFAYSSAENRRVVVGSAPALNETDLDITKGIFNPAIEPVAGLAEKLSHLHPIRRIYQSHRDVGSESFELRPGSFVQFWDRNARAFGELHDESHSVRESSLVNGR